MSNGSFQGWLWTNDGTSSDPTGYLYSPAGLHGSAANKVPISNVYLWEGNNEWIAQFSVAISESNLKQGGWNAFSQSSSNTRGTRGDGFGIFLIDIGSRYLFVPKRVFGYYDGSSTVTVFVTCNTPRIN